VIWPADQVRVCAGCACLFATTGRPVIRTPAGEFCTEDCLDTTWARHLRRAPAPADVAPWPGWAELAAVGVGVLVVWALLIVLASWWLP
jgi:hypothetical protein